MVGVSLGRLARYCGVSYNTIRSWHYRYNWARRRAYWHLRYWCLFHGKDTDSPEMAEIIDRQLDKCYRVTAREIRERRNRQAEITARV